MTTKKGTSEGNTESEPQASRSIRVALGNTGIGATKTSEELNAKLLRFQNKRLSERLNALNKKCTDLSTKLSQLGDRKAADDFLISRINSSWSFLDQNLLLLVNKFEAELDDDVRNMDRSAEAEQFIKDLDSIESSELDEKLQSQVKFSTILIQKLVSSFDKLLKRKRQLISILDPNSEHKWDESSGNEDKVDDHRDVRREPIDINLVDKQLKDELLQLQKENVRLNAQNMDLYKELTVSREKISQHEAMVEHYESKLEDYKEKHQSLDYEVDVSLNTIEKMKTQLQEVKEEAAGQAEAARLNSQLGGEDGERVANRYVEELKADLDEYKERWEVKKDENAILSEKLCDHVQKIESLSLEVRHPSKETITSSGEYKALLKQHEVSMQELLKLRTRVDDVRASLVEIHQVHQNQLDDVTNEHLVTRTSLTNQLKQSHEALASFKRENAVLTAEVATRREIAERSEKVHAEMQKSSDLLVKQYSDTKRELERTMLRTSRLLTELQTAKHELKLAKETALEAASAKLSNSVRGSVGSIADCQSAEHGSSDGDKVDASQQSVEAANEVRKYRELAATNERRANELINQLASASDQFDELTKQNRRLLGLQKDSDRLQMMHMSARSDAETKQQQAIASQKAAVETLLLREKEHEARNALIAQQESLINTLRASLRAKEKENRDRLALSEQYHRSCEEKQLETTQAHIILRKCQSDLKVVQQRLKEKAELLEQRTHDAKSAKDELVRAKKKLERLRKLDMDSGTPGGLTDVLKAEISDLKQALNCPACKTRRRNCVLMKCRHVFCQNCLQTRLDTRQRKCPDCQENFGANDFQRIYLK